MRGWLSAVAKSSQGHGRKKLAVVTEKTAQRADDRGEQQELLRHHPELFGEPLSPRRPHRTISNNVDHRHAIDLLKERLQSKWIAENVGIEPDVEVEHDPEAVRQGKDPQLEKTVELVMAELAKAPRAQPKQPAFSRREAFAGVRPTPSARHCATQPVRRVLSPVPCRKARGADIDVQEGGG
jgi:hypothetical protein